MMSAMMPSKFPPPEVKSKEGVNNFTFSINLKNTDKLNNFFRTGMLIADKSSISGTVLSDSILRISANTKAFSFKGLSFRTFRSMEIFYLLNST